MRLFFLALAALVLGGCANVTERVSQRFAPTDLPERVYDHEESDVHAATLVALEDLGYHVTRAAAAQGIIEAQSRRLPSEQFGISEQYEIEIRLRSVNPGVTSVTALVRQHTEGDFSAGATSTPIREHSRYGIFFERLEQQLTRK